MSNKQVIASELIFFQQTLGFSNQKMADVLGISEKTWLNRISSSGAATIKKPEREYLLLLADLHPDYQLIPRSR